MTVKEARLRYLARKAMKVADKNGRDNIKRRLKEMEPLKGNKKRETIKAMMADFKSKKK